MDKEMKKAYLKLLDTCFKDTYVRYEKGQAGLKYDKKQRPDGRVGEILIDWHLKSYFDGGVNLNAFDPHLIDKAVQDAKKGKLVLEDGYNGHGLLYKGGPYSLKQKCKYIASQADLTEVAVAIRDMPSFKKLPLMRTVIVRQTDSSMFSSLHSSSKKEYFKDELFYHIIEGLDDSLPIPEVRLPADGQAAQDALLASDTYETIKKLWAGYEKKNGTEGLNEGAKYLDIYMLEKELKMKLPDDLKASLLIHNGTDKEMMDDGFSLLSTEYIKDEYDTWNDLLKDGTFKESDKIVVNDKRIKKKWFDKTWIPVTTDGSGNNHCLDMAPAKDGVAGQVITLWHDHEDRKVIADSFLEALKTWLS